MKKTKILVYIVLFVFTLFVCGFMYNASKKVSADTSVGTYKSIMTDEVCKTRMKDGISGEFVDAEGRIGISIYTMNNGEVVKIEQEMYPYSFERENRFGIQEDGYNPNEFNETLIAFLEDLIGDYNSVGISYDSFVAYLNYLVAEKGMYEKEWNEWEYKYREANNALTEEEKDKIEAEKEEADKWQEWWDKEQEEAGKIQEEIMGELAGTDLSLYEREANMIERTIPPYIAFDKKLFVSLREMGYSFNEACDQSETIDYEKMVEYLGDKAMENKEWYKEMYDKINTESFIESLQNVVNNVTEMLKELFGI